MQHGLTPDKARMIFWMIWGCCTAFWIFGLYWIRRSLTMRPPTDIMDLPCDDRDVGECDIQGKTVVGLDIAEVSRRLSAFFATGLEGALGILEITESSRERLRVSAAGGAHRPRGMVVMDSATFTFNARGGETSVTYAASLARLARFCRRGAAIFLILGAIALVAVYCVMLNIVVIHKQIPVRYQVLQTAQVLHFLWPPFLFVFIYNRTKRSIGSLLHTLLVNLPHQKAGPLR